MNVPFVNNDDLINRSVGHFGRHSGTLRFLITRKGRFYYHKGFVLVSSWHKVIKMVKRVEDRKMRRDLRRCLDSGREDRSILVCLGETFLSSGRISYRRFIVFMTDVKLALVIQNATTKLGDSLDYFSRLITFPDIYLSIKSTPSVEK